MRLIYKYVMSRIAFALLSTLWLMVSPLGTGFGREASTPLSSHSFQATKKSEYWWEISILLTSRGKYTYKQSRDSYAGKYAYTIRWTGCMEQDEDDFILYHEYWDILDWKPQEKRESPEKIKILEAEDFFDKPCFTLNYILTRGENLFFDFLVKGIEIPQNCSKEKAYLLFPASKENSTAPSDIDYDMYIHKGSNQVAISKTALLKDSTKQSFHWSWQHQKWFDSLRKDPHLYQAHDVDMEVSIIRHRE